MARVIGLTGGIASGKSTVAAALRELGAQVIDADQLARQVVEPGQPAFTEIADRFGARVIDPDGRIDRKALGAIVFADPKARRDLEAITHPRIRAASGAAIVELAAKGHDPIIYEAALIVEKALHEQPWMDGLIVVAVPLEVQRQRLMARDGMTFEAAEQRLAAQLPLADKVAAADHVIDNAGSVADTRARVAALWQTLCAAASPAGAPDRG